MRRISITHTFSCYDLLGPLFLSFNISIFHSYESYQIHTKESLNWFSNIKAGAAYTNILCTVVICDEKCQIHQARYLLGLVYIFVYLESLSIRWFTSPIEIFQLELIITRCKKFKVCVLQSFHWFWIMQWNIIHIDWQIQS